MSWEPDLNSLLNAYKNFDPAAKSHLEIALLYPGVKAILLHRMAHFFYNAGMFFIARLIGEISRFLTGIEIHPGAKIGKNLVIDHGMGVVIGETTIIGDNCVIFHGVTLGGLLKKSGERRHPHIEDRVLIGAGAKILGPVLIGEGSKIGANVVIKRNLEKNSVVRELDYLK